LSILLQEKGYKCTFKDGSLKKEPVDYEYNFWKQRINAPNGNCTVGEKIHTGNFTWDQTIYATCNEDQPFVFCPSSKTEGIELVEGKRYACKFPRNDFIIDYKLTKTPVSFQPHELFDMAGDGKAIVNKVEEELEPTDPPYEFSEKKIDLSGEGLSVKLKFRYKNTYPADVFYSYEQEKPQLYKDFKTRTGAFLSKQKDFTTHPVNFPKHNAQVYLPIYNQDG
jgi:hypothetical protein